MCVYISFIGNLKKKGIYHLLSRSVYSTSTFTCSYWIYMYNWKHLYALKIIYCFIKQNEMILNPDLSVDSLTQSVRVKSFKHLDDSDKSIPLVFMSWHSLLSILSIFISITIGHCVLWAIKKSYFKFTLTLLADNA